MQQIIYKITKLGSVKAPFHKGSTFGESQPYHIGFFIEEPIVGERFNLGAISGNPGEQGISTSPVVEIVDNTMFKTLNSIYQYTPFF